MRVELTYMQCNISDRQALFWWGFFSILRMGSLDILFLCFGQQFRLCSYVSDSNPGFVLMFRTAILALFFASSQIFFVEINEWKKECLQKKHVKDMQQARNRYHIFFAYKGVHFTLFPFLQIYDIEAIFLILSLVSLHVILKFR